MSVEEYFADMWERWRRGAAKRARYEPWPKARLRKCHDNVDAYVREHPGCKAIRGAWVQPTHGTDGGYFIAHSLVELPDGKWVDITPLESEGARASLVFLEHRGTDGQFQAFRRIVREHWPPIPMPDAIESDFGSGEGLM